MGRKDRRNRRKDAADDDPIPDLVTLLLCYRWSDRELDRADLERERLRKSLAVLRELLVADGYIEESLC